MSVEREDYTFRIDHLRATGARIRFLSLEPLLGPLAGLDLAGIDWVIVGGESGPGARPMNQDWVTGIREQCRAASPSSSSNGRHEQEAREGQGSARRGSLARDARARSPLTQREEAAQLAGECGLR